MKVKKRFENEIFIIDEKDSELFERAKEQSDDIYFLIENLEFLRVDFVIESDMEKEQEKMKKITQKQKNEIIRLFDTGHLLALDYIKEHFGHKNIDLLIYLSNKYGWDNSFPKKLGQKYEELITDMFEDFGIDRYIKRIGVGTEEELY